MNESDAIFQAYSITMLMAVVDILCIVMVSSPTTNPDVISLLWVCQTFGIVSSVVWVIVWLQRLSNRRLAGYSISLNDWRLLISSIQIFHSHLDRIQFDWTTAEETTKSSEDNPYPVAVSQST